MSGRALLLAIDDDTLAALGEATTDAEITAIVDGLDASALPAVDLGRAWDAIHRLLTDGHLSYAEPRGPLGLAVLGGHRLHDGDARIVTVKAPDEVARIARALATWDRARARDAYFRIPRSEYGDLDEDDFVDVWARLEPMRAFYRAASDAEASVVFSVEP